MDVSYTEIELNLWHVDEVNIDVVQHFNGQDFG